ncbi:hypothetical protein GOBAR_DD19050 [Gossypium barbadense]|nr:hypothetical protein GOBAR_DD19050 [Gossypium barbadense]
MDIYSLFISFLTFLQSLHAHPQTASPPPFLCLPAKVTAISRQKRVVEDDHEEKNSKRKIRFDVSDVLKRYLKMVKPLLFFKAPVSMRTSPTNSGLLVSTTSDSTMEELQAAIQAAIAHCKNSIRGEDRLQC